MNKIKIISIAMLIVLCIVSSFNIVKANDINSEESYIQQEVIKVEQVDDYLQKLQKEIKIGDYTYKLEDTKEQENMKELVIEKSIEDNLIVSNKNGSYVLNKFNKTKEINEDGYVGTLSIDEDSLEITPNETYSEEYKVYLQKTYNNVGSNELNDIPKEIKENGIVYYLINPTWKINTQEQIGENNVPTSYNGIMYYEGVNTRTLIKNYKATIKYTGNISKKEIDTITITSIYKKQPIEIIEKDNNYVVPAIATTSAVVFFSGLIILKSKNAKLYNYTNSNELKLIKKIHINEKEPIINITPMNKINSNKYKLELNSGIYKKLKDKSVKIKYFDKEFNYIIKNKINEIFM